MNTKIINFEENAHTISDAIEITEQEVAPSDTNYPIVHEDGRLYCQVCGKLFKTITSSHLKKFHNMTINEYKDKYGTEVVSEATKARRKYTNSQIFKPTKEVIAPTNVEPKDYDDDVITDEVEEVEVEEIQNVIEEIEDTPVIEKEITDDKEFQYEEIPVPKKDPTMMKTEIAYLLENLFEGHKATENHIIEEFQIGSFVDTTQLKYSYACDVAVISKKIALFFPDTFWHNHDLNADPNRDYNLKLDDWNPITIHGNNPSFDQIVEALKNADLV